MDELLGALKLQVGELTLLPSTGGVFEVTLDGDLIFSKRELGRFPQAGELLAKVKERLAGA